MKAILNNKNISISEVDNKPYIEFIPYNRVITLKYLRKWINMVIRDFEDFALYSQGFNFDGLYETNKMLIEKGCIIQDNITGEEINLK